MLILGLLVLVAVLGLLVLGLLCLGLWRRTLALGREVGALSTRLETAQSALTDASGATLQRSLQRDLAALQAKHPGYELQARPRGS